MQTFKVRYKTEFGTSEVSTRYHAVDTWGKDKEALYFTRKGSAEFMIVRKENIIYIKLEKE